MNKIHALKILTFFMFLPILGLGLNQINRTSKALVPLNTNTCGYSQELVGRLGITLNGKGLIDSKINNTTYQDNFNVAVPGSGTPQKAYLYWTERYPTSDPKISIRINSGPNLNLQATNSPKGIFGPAQLNSQSTRYTGYIVDLSAYIGGTNAWNIKPGVNTFRVTKNLTSGTDPNNYYLFGAGVVVVYEDPSLPQQHLELKCGFDVTYADKTEIDSPAKWGRWSNVVCHQFDPANSERQVKYYAFMSGTKQRTTSNYRPNAFWYITGIGGGSIPANIQNLNKSQNQMNGGLSSIPGANRYADAFDANSGNEWDTFNTDNESGLDIDIPNGTDYICFQTESRNVEPKVNQYGLGSSMQWSMSALTFAYSGTAPTLTPPAEASATPTLTPTPTPIIYYPWLATIGGNVYSQSFDQTNLTKVNSGSSHQIQFTYRDSSTLSSFEGKAAFLSNDLFVQNSSGSIPARSSKNSFHISNYRDNNSQYKGTTSWFEYFKNYLLNIADNLLVVNNPDTNVLSVSDIPQIPSSADPSKVLVFTRGNTLFDIKVCDRKAIFIIEGDLVINPNLVVSGNENGCVFIVSGTTTITEGGDSGSQNGPTKTVYDQVHGYFITDSFVTQSDSRRDGLQIKGGVVTNSTSFYRTLGNVRNQYSPAEIIEYDPRYLYIYGDLFRYSFGYNIRESQFIRSIE